MKVHLQQIPPGETLSLHGEEDSKNLDLEEAGFEPVGPLHYQLEVGLSEGGLFATGNFHQKVNTTCVNCLEPFQFEVANPSFAMQIDLEGSELVDLTPEIREDIHLLLPMHPRCNLGGNKCPAQFPQKLVPSSEISENRPVWDALDHFKH